MSTEDEVELQELISKALELNGCLPKLRAELRANVFLALDEDPKVNNQTPLLNHKIKSYLDTQEGPLLFCLVQEFLEFFNLDMTSSVFSAESYLGTYYKYGGRQKVSEDLKLDDSNGEKPLLSEIFKLIKCSNPPDLNKVDINVNRGIIVGKTEKKHANCLKTAQEDFNGTYIVNNDLLNDSHSSSSSNKTVEETVNTCGDQDQIKTNGTTSEETNKSSSSSSTTSSTSNSPQSKTNDKNGEQKSKTPSPTGEKLIMKPPKNLYLDLPMIQLNKNRTSNNSDLLPSLCSKGMKEKLNSKEQEFGFDNMELEYEEDFMSSAGSDLEISAQNNRKFKLNDNSRSNSTSSRDDNVGGENKTANSSVISENLEITADNSSSVHSTPANSKKV